MAKTHFVDDAHDIVLGGAWNAAAPARPVLVARTDEDFLEATWQELPAERPEDFVRRLQPEALNGALRLHQPVHRVFNLIFVEAHCDTFMAPRLDPARIDSAGFVVRRVVSNGAGEKISQAWSSKNGRAIGWKNLDAATRDRDPDSSRRAVPGSNGHRGPDVDLRGATNTWAEQVTSLFNAPPEIARATGRTLLYGVVPVSSTARAGASPRGDEPARSDWEKHLSSLLKESSAARALWPAGSEFERRATLVRDDLKNFPARSEEEVSAGVNTTRFILLVRQLAQEFSLLRPVNALTNDKLIAALNELAISLVDGSRRNAGDYLLAAAKFYFEQTDENVSTLPRPKTWPAINVQNANRIYEALRQIAGEVELSVVASPNSGGRFDDLTARYFVRAFIRVKCARGCPPKLVWSEPGQEFTIVPWFESGPVPPVAVTLPDPFDPNFLKAARPGVAFSVPRRLANALNQDPKKLMDGQAGTGNLAVDWICGFNIPIITICAFVVLNVFLNLLNLVFWWLPFVKVCIPFPRKK